MDKLNDAKLWVAAIIGALTGLWGWLGWLVVLWIGMMILDYITGTIAAAQAGEWSSGLALKGIWHKVGIVFIVVAAAVADLVLNLVLSNLPIVELPFTYPGLICPIVLVWYIVMELGSIVENAVKMGAPVAPWLTKLLAVGKDAVDKAGESLTNDPKRKE